MLAIREIDVHLFQKGGFRLREDTLLVFLLFLLEVFDDQIFVFIFRVDVYDFLNSLVPLGYRKCDVRGRDNLVVGQSAEHCVWKESEVVLIQLYVLGVLVLLRLRMGNSKLLPLVHAAQVLAVKLAYVLKNQDNSVVQNDVQAIVLQRHLIHSNSVVCLEAICAMTLLKQLQIKELCLLKTRG